MQKIKSINWIFTYSCNLRCTHCDIWNNKNSQELSIKNIKDILSTPIIKESYMHYWDSFDIAISWWEPLLIKNLKEIMMEIDSIVPGAIHSISTNWTLKEKLIDLLTFWKEKGRDFRKVNISIDGSEKTHDIQRWIQWSFRRSIDTIQSIKKIFPKLIIEIKLTITKHNYKDILYISKLAYKLGIYFSFKPMENMLYYTNQIWESETIFSEEEISEIEKQIIYNPYIIKQEYYISKDFFYAIPKYLRNGLWESRKKCNVANDSISIMPDWKIHWCILMKDVWSIHTNTLDQIWNWSPIENQRKNIVKWNCQWCMLMCWSFKSKNIYEK